MGSPAVMNRNQPTPNPSLEREGNALNPQLNPSHPPHFRRFVVLPGRVCRSFVATVAGVIFEF